MLSRHPGWSRWVKVGSATVAVAGWALNLKSPWKPRPLVDWRRVSAVASRLAGEAEPISPELDPKYRRWVQQAEEAVASYSGLALPRRIESTQVLSRRGWIEANVATFQHTFAAFDSVRGRQDGDLLIGAYLAGKVSGAMVTSEMGTLMGYLSRRVLGQYDIALFGKESLEDGRVYFVEPNIAATANAMGVDGDDFRFWIALHETTHAFEFEANPWLRGHMNLLLSRYLDCLAKDLDSPLNLAKMGERIAGGLFAGRRLLELAMSPEQRMLFEDLQALMCLMEGYSNHVMQEVGDALIPDYARMKAAYDALALRKSAAERLFIRMTGLGVKREQYKIGEKFVGHVVKERGIEFVNRAWVNAVNLPRLAEVKDPDLWIKRIERFGATEARS